MATEPDMSMFGTGPDMSMFASKPKSDISNIGRGLGGAYKQAVTTGLLAQPVRWAMEAADYGGYKAKLRQANPGKSKEWYDKQIDTLYDSALTGARQDAAQQVADNPYPGQTVGNFAAGVLGSAGPDWLIAPGVGIAKGAFTGTGRQVAGNVAKHLGKQAAIQGTVGGATDMVTQGFDIAEGMQEGIDPNRLLTSAGMSAAFGAGFGGVQAGVHAPGFQEAVANSKAPDFIKGLFLERGRDLVPDSQPFKSQVGEASPSMTPENIQRHRDVLARGGLEDINSFYDEVGGPRPAPESIDEWLTQRDAMGAPAAPKPEVIERQIHRDNVRSHIDNETKAWKNKPTINVIDTLDEMTPEIRASAERDGITPENTVGFLGEDGQVHIFANQLKTPEQASAVLFHEALGHFGLAQRFGSKLDSTLQTLVARNVGQFGKKVEKWMKDNPAAYGGNKLRAAEEVLAEMSQDGPLPKSIADAMVSSVRQFARRMGVELKFSDAEVNHILAMAHDAVINGLGRDVIANRFASRISRDTGYQGTDFGSTDPNRQMYASSGAAIEPEGEWFSGPDGSPRFEISDHDAKWDDQNSYENPKGMDLDTVLIHPKLFKAYPELRNIKVVRDVSDAGDERMIQGYMDPGTGQLHISPRAINPRSTALHEIQHWIQFKEGLALGGSSDAIRLDRKESLIGLKKFYEREIENIIATGSPQSKVFIGNRGLLNTIQDRIEKVDELLESNGEVKQLYNVIEEAQRKEKAVRIQIRRMEGEMREAPEGRFKELSDKRTELLRDQNKLRTRIERVSEGMTGIRGRFSDLTYDMYNLLTGEVEARDVQARQYMTPEERAESAPYSAEGIRPDEMTSNFWTGGRATEQNAVGDELVDPNLLDTIDQMKANPRFWSDPEYRANVIEYARTQIPQTDEPVSIPTPLRTEAEYRAQMNRQMTPEQLQAHVESGQLDIDQIEQTYENAYKDYTPVPRSDAEVRRAAIDAGMSPSRVKRLKNVGDLSARIYRSQQAADVLGQRISGLLEKEGTPEWSARDADNLRQALVDHNYILAKLWDDTSEVGRALRVAKMGYTRSSLEAYKDLLKEHGGSFAALGDDETLNRFARSLKQLMAGGANPNGVNALVKGLSKPHWEEYLISLRTNMMLSGMSTHVTAVTDMINGIGFQLMDNTAALIPSAGREMLRAIGVPVKQGMHPAEVGARYWGIIRSAMEASTYANALKTLKEGTNREATGGRQYARIPVVSKVGDLIAAEDQFFRAFSTNMHLYGLGVRKAVDEARAAGKKPSFDDLISQGSDYARYPERSLLKEAEDLAESDLLLAPNIITNPLDAMRRSTAEGATGGAQRAVSFVTNFLLPFVRTATNSLYQRVWRRTPLTMFDPATLADLRAGGVKADVAMGRIMIGSAAVAYAWHAAGEGLISGEGPENPYKKAVKMGTGWRPKSVDAGDRYQINQNLGNRLDPFNLNSQTAGIVASLREAYDKGANEGQIATGMKLAVYSTIKSLADNVWLGDIADTIHTMSDPRAKNQRDQWVANQVTSYVPNLAGQIARVQDQGQPMTTVKGDLGATIENTFKSKIPGLRDDLPDRMTPFGEPVQSGATLAGQSSLLPQGNRVTGGAFIDKSTDPVVQEVSRLDEMFEESILTPVRRKIKVNGEQVELSNEEFSEYQRMAGIETVETIREMMGTEEWAEMSDEDKAVWIQKAGKAAKKRVREYLYDSGEN